MKNTRFNTYMRLLVLVLLFGQVSDLALCKDEGSRAHDNAGKYTAVQGDTASRNSNPDSNSHRGGNYDCPCVCHLFFDHPDLLTCDAQLTVVSLVTIDSPSYDFSSINTIDHPPTV